MEKYQDYIVSVNPSQWDEFKAEFRKVIAANYWKLREDLMERSKMIASMADKDLFCIETPEIEYSKTKLKGVIWMWMFNCQMEIFNVIPLSGNHLNCEEYNHIIACFNESVIKPMSCNFNLNIQISKPYLDVEDIIGKLAFAKLQNFSDCANKSTGHSHPLDEKRWFDFILSVLNEKKHLSTDDLTSWLIENGWFEEMAHKLSIDFEYSMRLLEYYEQDCKR